MREATQESILVFGALKIDQTNFLKNSLIIENKIRKLLSMIRLNSYHSVNTYHSQT